MRITFYVTRMLLGLLVVVDTYEEDVTRVFGYLRWIVFLFGWIITRSWPRCLILNL